MIILNKNRYVYNIDPVKRFWRKMLSFNAEEIRQVLRKCGEFIEKVLLTINTSQSHIY